MTFSQFLAIMLARWRLALGIFVGVVALAITVSLLLPKRYTATASVVVDVKSMDPIAGVMNPALAMPGYMATQFDILQSSNVLDRVVLMLGLDRNEQLREEWRESTDGKGSFSGWIGDRILKRGLDIKPSRESNVININFEATDARFATFIANAFAKAYIDANLDLRVQPAKQYSNFFDERLRKAREQLESTQLRLSNYQKEKGIVLTDERLDVETNLMNQYSAQLAALRALSAESNTRAAQSRKNAEQLQDVLNNPVIAALKTDLSRQEARLDELNARYGANHPQVVELRANITMLRNKIAQETARVTGAMGINDTISQSREGEVTAAYEAQRQKVLKMKTQQGELAVLQRELENAQRNYDAVQARLTQVSLESHTTQTNVSLLNPAVEPFESSSPKVLLNTILAVFVGGMLGVVVVLVREMLDRRIRSTYDVTLGLDLPVLGIMPTTAKKGLFQRRSKVPWVQKHIVGQLPGPSPKAT